MEIYNIALQFLMVVPDFSDFSFIKRRNKLGEFTFYTSVSRKALDNIKPGVLMHHQSIDTNAPEDDISSAEKRTKWVQDFYGVITSVETDLGAGRMLVFGRSLEYLLDNLPACGLNGYTSKNTNGTTKVKYGASVIGARPTGAVATYVCADRVLLKGAHIVVQVINRHPTTFVEQGVDYMEIPDYLQALIDNTVRQDTINVPIVVRQSYPNRLLEHKYDYPIKWSGRSLWQYIYTICNAISEYLVCRFFFEATPDGNAQYVLEILGNERVNSLYVSSPYVSSLTTCKSYEGSYLSAFITSQTPFMDNRYCGKNSPYFAASKRGSIKLGKSCYIGVSTSIPTVADEDTPDPRPQDYCDATRTIINSELEDVIVSQEDSIEASFSTDPDSPFSIGDRVTIYDDVYLDDQGNMVAPTTTLCTEIEYVIIGDQHSKILKFNVPILEKDTDPA